MTADDSLNKTVAKFSHNGEDYEIDWLTDQDDNDLSGAPCRNYDVFTPGSNHVASFRADATATKEDLIALAKEDIDAEEAMSV